jgi:hypothetical protein
MLKYRHTTVDDLHRIGEWVAADPAHAGVMKGSDFVLLPDAEGNLPKGRQCIEVQDENGTVFYVHLKQVLVMEVQFPPTPIVDVRKHQVRIMRATREMVEYFCFASKKLGHHAMFFQSVSSPLIEFCKKHLGFQKADDFFKVDLL